MLQYVGFFEQRSSPERPGYHYHCQRRVQITIGTLTKMKITSKSRALTEHTLQRKKEKQLGPPPLTEQAELKLQSSSSAPGTTPLDSKGEMNTAANSEEGLRLEVEQTPEKSGEHGHQIAIIVGRLRKTAEIVLHKLVSLLHGSCTSRSHQTICFLSPLPLRAEKTSSFIKNRPPAFSHRT